MDDLLGVDGWLFHQRESWVWVRGRFVPYPFQMNLHRLPETERAECVRGLITAAVASAAGGAAPASFAEWIDAAFGAGHRQRVHASLQLEGLGALAGRTGHGRGSAIVWPPSICRASSRTSASIVTMCRGDRTTSSAFRGAAAPAGSGERSRRVSRRRRPAGCSSADVSRRWTPRGAKRRSPTARAIRYRRLVTTMPLDAFVGADATWRRTWRAAARDLRLLVDARRRHRPARRGRRHRSNASAGCTSRRRTVRSTASRIFSHYSPNNVPDITAIQWSLMAEVSRIGAPAGRWRTRGRRDVVRGLVATGLIADRRDVHHTWHRRLEHGYPTPSLGRDRALERPSSRRSRRATSTAAAASARGSTKCRTRTTASRRASKCIDAWLDGSEGNDAAPARRRERAAVSAPEQPGGARVIGTLRRARRKLGAIRRRLLEAPETRAWRRAWHRAETTPRFTPGRIRMLDYDLQYSDLLSFCPQWQDIFVKRALEFRSGDGGAADSRLRRQRGAGQPLFQARVSRRAHHRVRSRPCAFRDAGREPVRQRGGRCRGGARRAVDRQRLLDVQLRRQRLGDDWIAARRGRRAVDDGPGPSAARHSRARADRSR